MGCITCRSVLSPLDGVGPADIRAEELLERRQKLEVEVIVATQSHDRRQEATAIYLNPIAEAAPYSCDAESPYGIPAGMDIEYADEVHAREVESRAAGTVICDLCEYRNLASWTPWLAVISARTC